MSSLLFFQVILNLGFLAALMILFVERFRLRQNDNDRMSRGLQLLTSKIAVFQDLLDRSETTGKQLNQILDRKNHEIQEKMEEVEIHLRKIQEATERSHEVAKIFQDKIPHQEIIERQNSLKYYQAAKLANQGMSIDDIAAQVEIPRGELELIVKLNREKMLVDKKPAWLQENQEETKADPSESKTEFPPFLQGEEGFAFEELFKAPPHEGYISLKEETHGEDSQSASAQFALSQKASAQDQSFENVTDSLNADTQNAAPNSFSNNLVNEAAAASNSPESIRPIVNHTAANLTQAIGTGKVIVEDGVRPVIFPKINILDQIR